jgi:hypothetical protein
MGNVFSVSIAQKATSDTTMKLKIIVNFNNIKLNTKVVDKFDLVTNVAGATLDSIEYVGHLPKLTILDGDITEDVSTPQTPSHDPTFDVQVDSFTLGHISIQKIYNPVSLSLSGETVLPYINVAQATSDQLDQLEEGSLVSISTLPGIQAITMSRINNTVAMDFGSYYTNKAIAVPTKNNDFFADGPKSSQRYVFIGKNMDGNYSILCDNPDITQVRINTNRLKTITGNDFTANNHLIINKNNTGVMHETDYFIFHDNSGDDDQVTFFNYIYFSGSDKIFIFKIITEDGVNDVRDHNSPQFKDTEAKFFDITGVRYFWFEDWTDIDWNDSLLTIQL